jgi:hypothetical protein
MHPDTGQAVDEDGNFGIRIATCSLVMIIAKVNRYNQQPEGVVHIALCRNVYRKVEK